MKHLSTMLRQSSQKAYKTGFRLASPGCRTFHQSLTLKANRAFGFRQNGNPAEVITGFTFPDLKLPPPGTLNIELILAPIHPADINVIEGVYPVRPSVTEDLSPHGPASTEDPVKIAGNEGLAKVMGVGDNVSGFKEGDLVVFLKQQSGTWMSAKNVSTEDVVRLDSHGGRLSYVNAATISVNPATAYNMIHSFTELLEGDWLVQNGANSAVGQAVIQVAAYKGVKTINLVRDRDDIGTLKSELQSLGATHVFTYSEAIELGKQVKELTGGKEIRLGLNCVGGKEASAVTRLLGKDAHLVTYGGMSKQPITLPTSLLIFKNLTSHGFWQSRWYSSKSLEDRQKIIAALTEIMASGKFQETKHEIVTISGELTDEEATSKLRDIISKINSGRYGKKVLLKVERTSS